MDASFEATFEGGSGWGPGDMTNAGTYHATTTAFDRVPLPVHISDVLNCQSDDDKFHVGIYSFGMLRVCGCVLSKEAGEKETHLVLCDPTERNYDTCDKFSVVVYQTSQGSIDYKENDIVIAIGKLRKFGGTNSMISFGITLVDNLAFVEAFKLEADLAKQYYGKNVPERLGSGACNEYSGTLFSNLPIVRGNVPNGSAAVVGNQMGGNAKMEISSATSNANRGLTGNREKIYLAIRKNINDGDSTGLHVADIRRLIGTDYPNFNADLQYLVNEGIIYNTLDDDHYATI